MIELYYKPSSFKKPSKEECVRETADRLYKQVREVEWAFKTWNILMGIKEATTLDEALAPGFGDKNFPKEICGCKMVFEN